MSVLLPYQARWNADKTPIKVIEKSRRIGLSFSTALDAVITAIGGKDVWYVGYDEKMCKQFIKDVTKWCEFLELTTGKTAITAAIATQVRFKSGASITGLSSTPRTLRGKQGLAIIDEAAFHTDLAALLKASVAFIMWGGQVAVISTHFGATNPFNELCTDIRNGKKPYSLHRITIDDALDDGFYELNCKMRGIAVLPGGREEWRQALFDEYGEFANEELLCIPDKQTSVYFSPELLLSCAIECQMLRYDFDDAQAQAQHTYKAQAAQMTQELCQDSTNGQIVIGLDFGRTQDLTAIVILVVDRKLNAHAHAVIEMHNAPFKLQEEYLHALFLRLPNIVGIGLDGTGNGSYLAETMTQHYGHTADNVRISSKWYAQTFTAMKEAMQSKRLRVPRDVDVLKDFSSVRIIDGIPRVPHQRTKSDVAMGGRTKTRHGDTVIAMALAHEQIACKCIGAIALSTPTRGGTHDDENRWKTGENTGKWH